MRRLLLVLMLFLSAPAWADPTLSLTGTARLGGVLFLRVTDVPTGATGVAVWAGREWPLSAADAGGAMRTLLPVPTGSRAGRQQLEVRLSTGIRLRRTVPVSHRHFPLQHISLDPSTLAGYDDPRNKADDERILASLASFDPVPRWSGPFLDPVTAPQSSSFGLRRLYNGWRQGWHKGVDLAAPEGEPVAAPAAGVVLHTATGIVNGNTVVLGHGLGAATVYLHLSDIAVEEGQAVEQGEVLGWVGGTGGFSPHLHWELRIHAEPVDPRSMHALPRGW